MSGRPVPEFPNAVAYLKPAHARPDRPPVMVKRLASPRGVIPPQLEPYIKALKAVKASENIKREVP